MSSVPAKKRARAAGRATAPHDSGGGGAGGGLDLNRLAAQAMAGGGPNRTVVVTDKIDGPAFKFDGDGAVHMNITDGTFTDGPAFKFERDGTMKMNITGGTFSFRDESALVRCDVKDGKSSLVVENYDGDVTQTLGDDDGGKPVTAVSLVRRCGRATTIVTRGDGGKTTIVREGTGGGAAEAAEAAAERATAANAAAMEAAAVAAVAQAEAAEAAAKADAEADAAADA